MMPEGAGRIVLINDRSIARGGATKLSLDLASGLSKRGRAVTYFAGDNGVNEDFCKWGVDVCALNGRGLLESRRSGFVNGLYNKRSVRALQRLIDDVDAPDVVYHVHGWSQILSPSIFTALKKVAQRTVLTAHDFFLACPNGNFTIYPKSRQCTLKPLSLQCIATDCDKRNYSHKIWRVARQASLNSTINFKHTPYTILAIQSRMIPYLVKGGVPEKQIRTLKNPAMRICNERVAAETNKEVLFIGRLEHEKGVDLLAAAAHKARASLRVIGEGPAKEAVKRANPDALFSGWLSHEEIATALRSARFLVMPSRCTEPFGLSAAEALSAGVPVLTSLSCLIGDDVKQYGMGDIVDVFDQEKFATVLSRWVANDALIEKMSENADEHFLQIGHAPDDWIDANIEIYDELVQSATITL